MTRDLSKNGDDKRTNKLLEYERTGDARMLLNSVYTTQKTHIGYGTESKIEYDTMTNNNEYKHVVFTDRENIPDMKAVTGTMLISEIHGNRDVAQPKIISARLPCACPPCRNNVMDAQVKCEYKNIRHIKEQLIVQNRSSNGSTEEDPLGLSLLTIVELKAELGARGMTKGGNKAALIARLAESMQSNDDEIQIDQGEVGIIDENDAEVEIKGMEEYNT